MERDKVLRFASDLLREPIPKGLAELPREMLEMVPLKPEGSPETYRQAANELSQTLRASDARMKQRNLNYVAH